MRDINTMVDTSRWDQSFVDTVDSIHSTSLSGVSTLSPLPPLQTHCSGGQLLDLVINNHLISANKWFKANNANSVSCVHSKLDHDTSVELLLTKQPLGAVVGSLDRIYENTSTSSVCATDSMSSLVHSDSLSCTQQTSTRSHTAPMANYSAGTCSQLATAVCSKSYSQVASFVHTWDMDRLQAVYRRLSMCGFYFGRLSIDESTHRLSQWPVGSFLLRDSSDPRFIFSVSIQTPRGTTSIRMSYKGGLFRLDSSPDQDHLMPTFDCALRLVSHYVHMCRHASWSRRTQPQQQKPQQPSSTGGGGVHSYVLLESSGRRDTPVLLTTAYRQTAPSLAHLCRTTIHSRLTLAGHTPAAVDRLQLIPSLKSYLYDYPYDL